VNVAKVTGKLKGQIHVFSGKLCFGLPKVAGRFVGEALFGICARQSLHLSEWGRSLKEKTSLSKTVDRLSRQLDRQELWEEMTSKILRMSRGKIGDKTLLIVDTSDISKPYAKKMEYLARVRDGSKKELADGYWTMHVIGGESGSSEMIPLYSRLYSAEAPDFEGENSEILKAVRTVCVGVGNKGIWVIDRGGDRRRLYDYFLDQHCKFIIRLKGDRHLVYRGKKILAVDLARRCSLPYVESLVREESRSEKRFDLAYGFCPVQLPDLPAEVYMVVVTGFGEEPMMLLTSLSLRKNRTVLWEVVESYLTRWKIEETIRFIKQSYALEDVRVLTYRRLQNMMALVLAVSYFTMAYIGQRVKLKAVSRLLLSESRRIFGVPVFRYYALADGIKELLLRSNKGPLRAPPNGNPQCQLALFKP
jgi:hypothetical protein